MKRKNQSKKSRAKSNFIKFVATLFIVSVVTCVLIFTNKNVSSADESANGIILNKYYKTITIQSGDTLWDIAKEYKAGNYQTTKEYVNELKEMNNLNTDNITSGQKLVVAYFAE